MEADYLETEYPFLFYWDRGDFPAQLGLYSLAARELTEKKLSCYLFILRNRRAIVLDDGIDWEERLNTFAYENCLKNGSRY